MAELSLQFKPSFSKVCVLSTMSLAGIVDVPSRVIMCAVPWMGVGGKASKLSTVYHPNRGYRYVGDEGLRGKEQILVPTAVLGHVRSRAKVKKLPF